MTVNASFCKVINKFFPVPVHPFNLANEGKQSYAEWQFERGEETIRFFRNFTTTEEMFKDKIVLDIGCGAGGKTLYYATLGAKVVFGIDPVEKYKEEATQLATKKGLQDITTFITGDAAKMPFESNVIDTIIMNDAMEHVDDPVAVLNECYRVLRKGGKLYINFPPYHHPYGAHLSDVIGIPWVHKLFDEPTLVQVYKDLVQKYPDANERINFRIGKKQGGSEYFSYINKMTLERFDRILGIVPFQVLYHEYVPLRPYFKTLSILPVFQEYFVKMVVCVLEKASTKTHTSIYDETNA
ncbi:methyltransferase [Desulfuribacillus stibiiarsenatis]|uniref:Methyltransferase n=1 Tax=Desulfuribacillus stibiiarsenatis TaxID=1390249 RepID=A0A1E5L633_9FIRM|nr:class I SAM-dependent methyltransferase [Desulfuribacillus stibiiarsenatis]OEH85463.1 methyltransferase [Desulfuribacillus stibiiarsenatis]